MTKLLYSNTMGGVVYDMYIEHQPLKLYPLYYSILKWKNGEVTQTDKVPYEAQCVDLVRTIVAEETYFG